LTHGKPPVFRINGLIDQEASQYSHFKSEELILSMLNDEQVKKLKTGVDVDFCYTLPNGLRQRVNVYRQQGQYAATLRNLNDEIPTIDQLKLPEVMKRLASLPRGLVLVTGATGSGKSTTLAAMIDFVNDNFKRHIVTIEDPIEYVHKHKNCLIHQREVGDDVTSFASALRSSLREDPDVILVGEMRDLETIGAAITAAETGHLVLSTLHTSGAVSTIDRIIDVFPSGNQAQIRTQLAAAVKGVISQQLLRRADGAGRTPAFEIMVGTDAIANLVREGKNHQIMSMIQSGMKDGMMTLEYCLAQMVRNGVITKEMGLDASNDKQIYKDLL
jgi:twitching motility protein PilT